MLTNRLKRKRERKNRKAYKAAQTDGGIIIPSIPEKKIWVKIKYAVPGGPFKKFRSAPSKEDDIVRESFVIFWKAVCVLDKLQDRTKHAEYMPTPFKQKKN